MQYEQIEVVRREQAAWLYLKRPKAMNSITMKLVLEMEDALTRLEGDDHVRVLVISGKGAAFCAGADLKEFQASMKDEQVVYPDFLDCVVEAFNHVRRFPKPVIASLNGLCLAGGLELTMCCDLVIAAQSAKLGDAHSNFGVFPGAGGAAVLPSKIGLNRAKYVLFTGDFVSAAEMKDFGLVNQVVPDDQLEATVQTLADKLAAKSPLVLRRMKEVANQSLGQSRDAALHHEMVHLRQHMRSHDIQEGLAAFSEKRRPAFKGR